MSDWEGGVRVNAWVSGGFLPAGARGTKVEGYMHIADWCDETRPVSVFLSVCVHLRADQGCDVLRARGRGAHRRPSSSRRAAAYGLDQVRAENVFFVRKENQNSVPEKSFFLLIACGR